MEVITTVAETTAAPKTTIAELTATVHMTTVGAQIAVRAATTSLVTDTTEAVATWVAKA
jgi:hypothetical protein